MCEHGLVPKIVDHEARRGEIALAVRRLVAREGLAGATVRAVADESGWSMGAVRYYFASQDQLLVFAVESMMEQVTARVLRIRERMPAGPDRAAALIEQLLPRDAERRAECTVWLAALARARHDPTMDELRHRAWAGERHLLALAICDARGVAVDFVRNEVPERLVADVDDLQLRVDGATLIWTNMADQVRGRDLSMTVRNWVEDLAG